MWPWPKIEIGGYVHAQQFSLITTKPNFIMFDGTENSLTHMYSIVRVHMYSTVHTSGAVLMFGHFSTMRTQYVMS